MRQHYFILIFLLVIDLTSCNDSESEVAGSIPDLNRLEQSNFSTFKLSGISVGPLLPPDYIKWVINHYREEKTENGITYSLLYKPYDYVVCLECIGEEITSQRRNKILTEINGLEYFDLTIGTKQENGPRFNTFSDQECDEDYEVKYYAFDFQRNILLITAKGDTIHPSIYHFERAYDLLPCNIFLLGFRKELFHPSCIVKLIVRDTLFNRKTIEFDLSSFKSIVLPKLQTT